MVKGQLPFCFAPQHGSRIGLLKKGAKDAKEMQWFTVRSSRGLGGGGRGACGW
jgi:hypothetical protein